ncbi:glycosyltransferase family 4 protein [Vibrio sp. MA40-2]|uniref:glycosyltransferase family 4 protein n=1 Tax=Vibrio sp. MA40-2 TaxID=3391828 RepID=UPI0039A555E5
MNGIHRLISIHPFDPTGTKVGGIETHIRHVIKLAPQNIDLIFVGVDESNTLELGKLVALKSSTGREYQFLPVMHTQRQEINKVASNVFQSLTFNYFMALLKYRKKLKSLYKEQKSTVEIQRYEFSWICKLLGFDHVLLTHGDIPKGSNFDSLISKLWFINKFNEKRAILSANKVISVSSAQTERLKKDYPRKAQDINYMTVSVDDTLFKPTPYDCSDGILKLAFAGRLDIFKRPDMMFDIVGILSKKLDGKVEFHYVGVSDTNQFPEYQKVKDKVILHGYKQSAEISQLWPQMHVGLVTSTFEGWPVYVMEAVCSGRPVVSLKLDQMANTFEDGQCGTMLSVNQDDAADLMADEILSVWEKIQKGSITPESVNAKISPFKASKQMNRLFEMHLGLV